MKPTLKFVSLILSLILCVGVTVSCFRSIASDGPLDFTIGGSRFGSGSVFGGSSGGSFAGGSGSGSSSTSSGQGSGGPSQPLPANYYDVGNQRYHLEGYTAYPSSSVNPNWFLAELGDQQLVERSGNDFTFCQYKGDLSGCFSFGTEAQDWHFSGSGIQAVGISFTLDPSDCPDLYGSVTCIFSSQDQAYDGFYPLFKVKNNRFLFLDSSLCSSFLLPSDISYPWPDPVSVNSFFFEEDRSPEEIRFLVIVSSSRLVVYMNDMLSINATPNIEFTGYDLDQISSILRLTFDGSSHQSTVLKNVCFYVK